MANENNNNDDVVAEAESLTIRQVQQSFAGMLGYGDRIIWDLLSEEQSEVLKTKIKELIRNPVVPEDLAADDKERDKIKKRINALDNMRELLFNSIWEQRKYTNRVSLTSIIYVLVATDEMDANLAEKATVWSCHPVFRTRRCITGSSGESSNSSECCMIFIDENGRVYQNWMSYVEKNQLPSGIMVAPELGIYNLSEGRVQLVKYLTPVSTPTAKALGVLDTTTAVGGFAAACVPVAAILSLPVAAPVMAVAAGVGLVTAGYGALRSGTHLYDRNQHEQSINVTDRAARGHWLGVLAGAVGFGAAGATTAMTAAATAGQEVNTITQLTVNGLNISTILLSGTGVVNGALDLILKHLDGDKVSTMDILQLSASLVLFTHSVANFRLASNIIHEAQTSRIANYRETLSNRQRRAFDKLSMETERIRGSTRGRLDIIRGINDVPSKQQFNDLYKINKALNKQGIRPAFGPDGQGIVLNDQVHVSNTQELRANVQQSGGASAFEHVTQPIPATHEASGAATSAQMRVPTRLLGPTPKSWDGAESTNFATGVRKLQLSSIVVNGVIVVLRDYGSSIFENIANAESFENLLTSMADRFEADIFRFILDLTQTFMGTIMDDLHTVLKFFISTESVLYRILSHILDEYGREFNFNFIEGKTLEILNYVKSYYMSLNPNNYADLLKKCNACSGYYSICQL